MRLKFIIFGLLVAIARADEECRHRSYGFSGTVCVCDGDYCDTTSPVEKVDSSKYLIYTSNLDGLRLFKQIGDFQPSSGSDNPAVIDHSVTYQTVHGFGGAFTDATGININSLADAARTHLMRSYFSKDGIEYNLGRVPIGGTDFSTRAYTYLDTPEPDMELAKFALQPEDFNYKIPLIKQATELSENEMSLFASAWTAPIWMKTNNEYAGSGYLRDEMGQLWVDYFIKFLDKYHEAGIDFWGITTGNEPSLAFFTFTGINTVGWLPWTMNKWIRRHFGPTFRNSQYSQMKLITHDDQRILIPLLDSLFADEEARSYIDGIGVHWYWNDFVPATWLTQTHNKYPEMFIMGTEACKGDRPWDAAVELGSWERGEKYAVDVALNLQNWATGWVDWNMALNETGGPTYINNNVDSPIIVNATAGEFYKQPMFYALGHFSKFIPRGSIKIEAPEMYNGLILVALDRPDEGTVVIAINTEERNIPLRLSDGNRGMISTEITPKSFNTILYW